MNSDEWRSSAESFAAVWPAELDLQQALCFFCSGGRGNNNTFTPSVDPGHKLMLMWI